QALEYYQQHRQRWILERSYGSVPWTLRRLTGARHFLSRWFTGPARDRHVHTRFQDSETLLGPVLLVPALVTRAPLPPARSKYHPGWTGPFPWANTSASSI